MMKLLPLVIILPLFSLSTYSAIANDYQSFTSIGYSKFDSEFSDLDSEGYGLNSTYFFDKKSTLGPLNEFKYINTISNVSAGYSAGDWTDSYGLSGELFINNFLVAASYNGFDTDHSDRSPDIYNMSLGYLISDDFLVKVTATKAEEVDVFYQFSAAYNWQLNANDYIGFSYNTDENLDFHTLSSKYYVSLAQDQYLTANFSYVYFDDDDFWSVGANYYFNKNTSVLIGYTENEIYSLGVKHYFNNSYALSIGYSSNSSNEEMIDFDSYDLNFTAQF